MPGKATPPQGSAALLVKAIDQLLQFCRQREGQDLYPELLDELLALDGKVWGLATLIGLELLDRPSDHDHLGRTGMRVLTTGAGRSIVKDYFWQPKMLSLRAAAQAMADRETAAGGTGKEADADLSRTEVAVPSPIIKASMAAFDQLMEPLSEVLRIARRMAEVSMTVLSNRPECLEEIRTLRRDLPSSLEQVMLNFHGDVTLTSKLKHELDGVQQDAFEMADWIGPVSARIQNLQEALGSGGDTALDRWAGERDKAFQECEKRKQRVNASCNRAQEKAGWVCAAVDRAAATTVPTPPPSYQKPLESHTKDSSEDIEKKPRKIGKRGPRNTTEFLKFKAAIEKGQRRGRLKKAVALEFTDGDEKKALALLKKLTRHKDLPP